MYIRFAASPCAVVTVIIASEAHNNYDPIFQRLWTKVHEIVNLVGNPLQFPTALFTIVYIVFFPKIFAIKSRIRR